MSSPKNDAFILQPFLSNLYIVIPVSKMIQRAIYVNLPLEICQLTGIAITRLNASVWSRKKRATRLLAKRIEQRNFFRNVVVKSNQIWIEITLFPTSNGITFGAQINQMKSVNHNPNMV